MDALISDILRAAGGRDENLRPLIDRFVSTFPDQLQTLGNKLLSEDVSSQVGSRFLVFQLIRS